MLNNNIDKETESFSFLEVKRIVLIVGVITQLDIGVPLDTAIGNTIDRYGLNVKLDWVKSNWESWTNEYL